jgi:hypothetical protein
MHGLSIGSIDFGERGRSAKLLDGGDAFVAALGAAAGHHHGGACLRETVAELAAENASAADHDGDAAI